MLGDELYSLSAGAYRVRILPAAGSVNFLP